MVLLNAKQQLIKVATVSLGSVNESFAHPSEVFKPAIVHSAYFFILVRNHPSGDPSPSEADMGLTRRILEASRILQLQLVDHVIIGAPGPGRSSISALRREAQWGRAHMFNPCKKKPFEIDDFAKLGITEAKKAGIYGRRFQSDSRAANCYGFRIANSKLRQRL